MKVLKTELDGYTLETIDFMEKVDESFRKRIHRYARLLYSEYQEELEQNQKENQYLQIIKTGGMI